jgi:hypothetical protein
MTRCWVADVYPVTEKTARTDSAQSKTMQNTICPLLKLITLLLSETKLFNRNTPALIFSLYPWRQHHQRNRDSEKA